ncbi:chromosome partitioning ATPase Soj-related protein [Syntrophotalea carbinolica DSM 2380]|uniref:Chromosome partitioning ATPase Soj-related protein n=1 Tax=Syntrophotalea carbinolica (strain DSM 2380 / NBRC 103641 / GraBd1) TaxID=338963 RepID=Q3A5W6_SYNC1|nr:AAA family ATPase [Syntrophotalea carbinolica]ABA88241.2 chromosome partitioning ATPase Soj-related protein [Syntrophotalea carbinolica DSM 2380]
MKLISLFNHKGGVSKTTTAFNLGWVLAEQGHKTLIVDADPQCNLTALVLDYNSVEDIEDFYAANPGCDLSTGLQPVMSGRMTGLQPGNPAPTANDNLFIYCGNLALSEIETQVSVALTTSEAIPAIKNLPGSIGQLLRITGEAHDFEYIIIDMSPSVGALNECLLMSSNFFIVPTSPDFFCAQAIRSLSSVIPRWNEAVAPFRDREVDYRLPNIPPKFIGFISQRYRPRSGAPAKSFQRWIDIIKETVSEKLIPALEPIGMAISKEEFANYSATDEPYNLANVADFNSLIAQSQKFNVPIFALSDDQLEQGGVILQNMKESRDSFRQVFEQMAGELHEMTENV